MPKLPPTRPWGYYRRNYMQCCLGWQRKNYRSVALCPTEAQGVDWLLGDCLDRECPSADVRRQQEKHEAGLPIDRSVDFGDYQVIVCPLSEAASEPPTIREAIYGQMAAAGYDLTFSEAKIYLQSSESPR